MREYFDRLLNTINTSIGSLDMGTFEELSDAVVTTLKNGKKVVVTGLGKNVPICDKFVGTMSSLGLDAAFMHTNTAVHGDLGMVHDCDLVIILSKSGETAESLYLLNELRKRDVVTWSITFNKGSSLAKGTDHTMFVSMDEEGDKWNIVPNNSTTLYLIILQALAIDVSDKMGVTLEDFRKNHPGGHIGVLLNERKH